MLVIFHCLAAAPEHDPHVTQDSELIAPGEGLAEEVTKYNRRHKAQKQANEDQTRQPDTPDVGNALHDLFKIIQGL